MGVINMAHGEFMILGAYITYLTSTFFTTFIPFAFPVYFMVAVVLAFCGAGLLGMVVEWTLIRHLYKRPLDTLLATWGLSLILQQVYRSVFGAREVGVDQPDWMMGATNVTDTIQIPINGLIVMGLTAAITIGVYLLIFRMGWGKQVRAVMQNRAMGRRRRHQHGAGGPLHLRHWLRHRWGGGLGLHHDRLNQPHGRAALHRRHLPGRRIRRSGKPGRHCRLGFHHLPSPLHARILPQRIDGAGPGPAHRGRHPNAAPTGTIHDQGSPVRIAPWFS